MKTETYLCQYHRLNSTANQSIQNVGNKLVKGHVNEILFSNFFMTECGQANQCINTFELVFQVEEFCTNSCCCFYQGLYDPLYPLSGVVGWGWTLLDFTV
jgi:hypothetical protein